MSLRRNEYRNKPHRTRYLRSRVTRIFAVLTTIARSLIVTVIGAGVLSWGYQQLPTPIFAFPVGLTIWQVHRSFRYVKRRRKGSHSYESVMNVPDGVVAAVKDLAPQFGLRARRLDIVVTEYGHGKMADLPLAAAAGWLGGGVVIIDDDLARKALVSRPGDKTDQEVRAVVAHELAHIYALDSLNVTASLFAFTSIATTAATVIANQIWIDKAVTATNTAGLVAATLLALLATLLLDRWVARQCEHAADRRAAQVLGTGTSLASALQRDFGSGNRGWRELFDSHPATHRRIKRLQSI